MVDHYHNSNTYPKIPTGSYLPTYSLYLIGLFYILLLIVIGVLAYLLYRSKFNQYKIMVTPTPAETTMQRSYSTQVSTETPSIQMETLNKKINEDSYAFQAFDQKSSQNELSEPKKMHFNKKQSMITDELRRHQRMKMNGNHNVMLKDDIHKICEKELGNGTSTSLRDLHKLIHGEQENASYQVKSISTDPLELDEYYGEVKGIRPVTQSNIDVTEIPMYDCIPGPKNIVIGDGDAEYLFPISREDLSMEPTYINAHYKK